MRSNWNLHLLPALAAVLSLACSPPVPVAKTALSDTSDSAEASAVSVPITISAPIIHLDRPPDSPSAPTGFNSVSANEPPGDFAASISTTEAESSGILDALGELTGRYEVTVTRLSDDCTFGPDVPFDSDRNIRNLGFPGFDTLFRQRGPNSLESLGSGEVEFPFTQTYYTDLVQRGDVVGFELGEGIVFARPAGGLLTDVERVGADGVTLYLNGFSVGTEGEGDERTLISGESDWEFYDDHKAPGEVCAGRTSWEMLRILEGPTGGSRDLHFSLRWSAESLADLDLVIGRPSYSYSLTQEKSKNYFGEVNGNCYVVRSVGYAVAEEGEVEPTSFVAELGATTIPYHEEVISCSWAPYGRWSVEVVNWNSTDEVYYELGSYGGAFGERTVGYTQGTVSPLEMDRKLFDFVPPPTVNAAGLVLTSQLLNQPAQRIADSVSGTFLAFNKAAYEGFTYDEFLEALGL